MNATWVERGTLEWEAMWRAFADPDEGEGWQYMGTWDGCHEFRNRCLNGERVCRRVASTARAVQE
jgi:hypothetical protein